MCYRRLGVGTNKKAIAIGVIVAGATILYFFNPEGTIWLPKCPFYVLTGCKCPACGTQRAIYSLLHLDVIHAIRYNLFMLISMPYAISLIAVTWFDPKNKLNRIKKICHSPITINIYVVLIILWWIVRNLIKC